LGSEAKAWKVPSGTRRMGVWTTMTRTTKKMVEWDGDVRTRRTGYYSGLTGVYYGIKRRSDCIALRCIDA
jgi:hypothetical protein